MAEAGEGGFGVFGGDGEGDEADGDLALAGGEAEERAWCSDQQSELLGR